AGYAVHASIDRECMVSDRPGHLVLGVVVAGVLPGNPTMRNPVSVECQYEWMHGAQCGVLCGSGQHDESVSLVDPIGADTEPCNNIIFMNLCQFSKVLGGRDGRRHRWGSAKRHGKMPPT